MKMMIGSTWNAKMTPNGPLFVPSGAEDELAARLGVVRACAFTPRRCDLEQLAEIGLQHQKRESRTAGPRPTAMTRSLMAASGVETQPRDRQDDNQAQQAREPAPC